MNTISSKQLFILIIVFILGNILIFPLGIDAEEDAWLAVLLAMIGGLVMVIVHTTLYKKFPTDNILEIAAKLSGKYLATVIALIYILYLLYVPFLSLGDFSSFFHTKLLPNSNMLIINLLIIFNVAYLIISGIEVLARVATILFFLVVLIIIISVILTVISPDFNLDNLRPFLKNGIKPVLKVAFPDIFTFPFGDFVILLMYLPYLNNKKNITKISLLAVSIAGLLVSLSVILITSILSSEIIPNLNSPILVISTLIVNQNVLANIDPLIALFIFFTGFIKITMYIYAAVLAIKTLFKIERERQLKIIIIFSCLIPVLLTYIPKSIITRTIWQKNVPEAYFQLVAEVIIPIGLLIITLYKKTIK